MKKVMRIDTNGYYVEDALLEDNEKVPKDCIKTNVPEGLHTPLWDSTNLAWVEGKADADLLSLAKEQKMAELDAECNKAILSGFDYTINTTSYHFSLSLAAQSNFQETNAMFKEAAITSETWTVLNNGTGEIERISLDEATFNAVRDVARQTVRDNISKLRDTLQPQVEVATTIADVEAVVW